VRTERTLDIAHHRAEQLPRLVIVRTACGETLAHANQQFAQALLWHRNRRRL
jgi:hypothetical protein